MFKFSKKKLDNSIYLDKLFKLRYFKVILPFIILIKFNIKISLFFLLLKNNNYKKSFRKLLIYIFNIN